LWRICYILNPTALPFLREQADKEGRLPPSSVIKKASRAADGSCGRDVVTLAYPRVCREKGQ
jgi:hypothetical protein